MSETRVRNQRFTPDRSEKVYETQAAIISVGARRRWPRPLSNYDGPRQIVVRDELLLLPVGKVAKASASSDPPSTHSREQSQVRSLSQMRQSAVANASEVGVESDSCVRGAATTIATAIGSSIC